MKLFKQKILERLRIFYTLNFTGTVGGFIGFCAALTPSLMPRPVAFMGVLAGLGLVIGYGLGVWLSYVVRWLGFKEPRVQVKRVAWIVVRVGFLLGAIIFTIVAAGWQNEVRELVSLPRVPSINALPIVGIAFIVASVILALCRAIWGLFRRMARYAAAMDVLPKRAAALAGGMVAAMIIVFAMNGVLLRSFLLVANAFYSSRNSSTDSGVLKPMSPLRSGSDDSLVNWDTLGRHGRSFVSGGPHESDIQQVTGRLAKEPIRAYVGLTQAKSARERAKLAVAELERTGAFDRKYIVVATTTGSGWVEPAAAAAVEYLNNGDTAQVALQYSYLPSWLALLVNRQDATDHGRALFEAVYDKVQLLEVDKRPRILSYGLSLGAYGSQAAFGSAADIAARTDGALYLGTPGFTPLWRDFTNNRDPYSPEILPVYNGGRTVRFSSTSRDMAVLNENQDWRKPRVLYLQYASDPIVWWQPSLLWSRPDWLSESPGHDVSRRLKWFPVLTFLQITVDQFFANNILNSHGHNYAPDVVQAWAAVTESSGWSQEGLYALQQRINQDMANSRGSSIEE